MTRSAGNGKMGNEKGFTLSEILVASAIGMMLLGAIYAAVVTGQHSSVAIERKVATHQDARAALELMAAEIQMASYNPAFASSVWRTFNDCGSTSLAQTRKGLQEATSTSITTEMDLNESSAVGDASHEIIRYAYIAGEERITRETNCGGAQPFLGEDPLVGTPRTTRVVNGNAGIDIFRYYDGAGNLLASPPNAPNVRRVEITLVVETDLLDPNTQQRRRMIYSTSVIPRNHAISQ
ncbi:MAG TPA: prepilin-type N-terminal cleavage/methylation domain-containing protein [Syntrophales bacterium]|nr:prepilin-type N-terminal cleavage/methylation domain-containing protein [Syntrophales bacterium]